MENEVNAKRKIAVIGAGPAGLSCAYFLARLGYRPRVFEAQDKVGGMLVQTIPAYRLPREELEAGDPDDRAPGSNHRNRQRLWAAISLSRACATRVMRRCSSASDALKASSWESRAIGRPGVMESLDFLREYNTRGKSRSGKHVAVIGGGNAAIDAARTALRLGAEKVTIVYRRTRAQMPAWEEEIDAAEEEGIELMTLIAPMEVVAENGRVSGLKCRQPDSRRLRQERPAQAGSRIDTRFRAGLRPGHRGHRPDAGFRPLLGSVALKTTKDGRPVYDPTDRPDLRTLAFRGRRCRGRTFLRGGCGRRRAREPRRESIRC